MNQKQLIWRKKVIDWLENNVSAHRLNHILGVEKTCLELAAYHQVPTIKAAKAGLLHDLAKFFPPDKLLRIASQNKLKIDSVCRQHPHLLHADVSAIVARENFEVNNSQILEAIKNHTLGNPKMSPLSCILYIADAIEPSRGDNLELKYLRTIASQNLYQGVWKTSDYALKYLIDNGKVIHPRTVLTRNWALRKTKKSKAVESELFKV